MRWAIATAIVALTVLTALLLADGSPAGTDQWRALHPASRARTEVAAARIGGSIYVAGGYDLFGRGRAVERYDIRRRRWSQVRQMPFGLHHATAVAHRGRLYVHGGYRSRTLRGEPTSALLRYDPGQDRWRRLPAAPTRRAAHAAAVVDGRLYVAGGTNDSGSLSSLEVYDFARRRWSRGPGFPGPARNHTAGVAADGRFYVLAGRDAQNYANVERYDPRRRKWQSLPNMRTPRGGFAAARLRDGRIVVFGGEDLAPGGETIREVELFDPRSGRWSRLPGMRTPRHGLGGAALGNRVFAIEGGPSPGLAFSDAIEFLDVRPR